MTGHKYFRHKPIDFCFCFFFIVKKDLAYQQLYILVWGFTNFYCSYSSKCLLTLPVYISPPLMVANNDRGH